MTLTLNRLTDRFYAAPQIAPADLAEARAQGFDLVINNRPDGEEAGQPTAAEIEAAAGAAGLDYIAIPIGRDGISEADMTRFIEATNGKQKVLGFCRTGTRSTILRSMAEARNGTPAEQLLGEAAEGGYDISGQTAALRSLHKG